MLGILLLASAVFGQTSLFDMKYGDSYSQTIARLKSKGFVEVDHSDKHYHLSGGAKSMLPEIMVYLSIDGKSVFSWKVTYDLKSDPAAEKKVIASLVDLHGKYSVKDDYDYNYIWYFQGKTRTKPWNLVRKFKLRWRVGYPLMATLRLW